MFRGAVVRAVSREVSVRKNNVIPSEREDTPRDNENGPREIIDLSLDRGVILCMLLLLMGLKGQFLLFYFS